jgi:hypothetical protein
LWYPFRSEKPGLSQSRSSNPRNVVDACGIEPRATHVVQHAEYGYTTNTPLAEVMSHAHNERAGAGSGADESH